jgi:DNA replication protein DnaC
MGRKSTRMERMGDILARTATRRYANLQRAARLPKVKNPSAAPLARPTRRASAAPANASVSRRSDSGQRPEDGQRPTADTVESDQVLELPSRGRLPRRQQAPEQDQTQTGASQADPGKLTPIGEVTRTLLARRHAEHGSSPEDAASGGAAAPVPPQRGNSQRRDEPAVCSQCGGAGYVRMDLPMEDPSFGKPVPCRCREREWEERRRLDLRRFSSLDPFYDKTFETFNPKVPGVREAFDAARRYADDPQGWLVLRGGYGCGKTHLAAAIANAHLAAGAHVFFSIVPDLLDHLRAAFAPTSEIRYDEMFERVREAGLLVLDDLGAENGTAWATEKLFQIINYRYNFRMPTVITTNSRLLSHMDERLSSRLSDIGLVHTIVLEAQDYRKRHAAGAAVTRSAPSSQRGRPPV